MQRQQILGDVNLFLMLSRIVILPHFWTARLRPNSNQATADLLRATELFRETLIFERDDYDSFCNTLSTLGGFHQPHTVDGISADWVLPYQLLNNGLGDLLFLYGILAMLPLDTKLFLPLTPQQLPQIFGDAES